MHDTDARKDTLQSVPLVRCYFPLLNGMCFCCVSAPDTACHFRCFLCHSNRHSVLHTTCEHASMPPLCVCLCALHCRCHLYSHGYGVWMCMRARRTIPSELIWACKYLWAVELMYFDVFWVCVALPQVARKNHAHTRTRARAHGYGNQCVYLQRFSYKVHTSQRRAESADGRRDKGSHNIHRAMM